MSTEFGRGLCYCLGLFLAHTERIHSMKELYKKMRSDHPDLFKESDAVHMWFNGAGDHICEMTPEAAPTPELQQRAAAFKSFVMARRFDYERGTTKEEDWKWSVDEAMSLLLEIDKAYGIDAEEAEWK